MPKKTAILAVALFCLLSTDITFGATTTHTKRTTRSTAALSRNQRSRRRTVRTTATTASLHRVGSARRRRARRYNPWRVSDFGNPGQFDNPTGDDPGIRAAAIEALGNWNGAMVVVDPKSGRILSIVNQSLALSGAFTPCSTFKPVVALGALKEGIITPQTKLGVLRRDGGRLTLRDAIAHSNNLFFAKLGEMLGFRRVEGYAREFGLGEKAGLDIPGESAGVFPSTPPKEGGVGYLAYCGQNMQVTTLQLAAIVSTIANGGTLYYLQYPRTQEEVASFEPKVRRRLADVVPYLPDLKEAMAAAVLYGTARSAYNPEEEIFGKTGTCSQDGAHLGWFASFAKDNTAEYVVVVLLRGGRLTFGPHAAEIAGQFYKDLLDRQKASIQAGQEMPAATRSPF